MAEAAEVIPEFAFTARQEQAKKLISGSAVHNMLFGGSRSGKTFLLVWAVLMRAVSVDGGRHACLRYRFNHIKASLIFDTFPKVAELCFPGLWENCKLDKTDWYLTLPNGSEIWFAGLDDKERTEKILGLEFATMYLNECSQIPWASRNIAVTRLAQNVTGLRNKMYYDCNPPSMAHWTYKIFQLRQDPNSRAALPNQANYTSMQMNPTDNTENLPQSYLDELDAMSSAMRKRFLLGMFSDESTGQLWTYELLDQQRITNDVDTPEMLRIVIAVDPSGCRGAEDERSDEIGIVVCGLGVNQKGYILEDLSGKYGATGDNSWGKVVVGAYRRWKADRVIGESNFGGDMVKAVIDAGADGDSIPYTEVKASRGKVVRADPVAALFEAGKIHLIGKFDDLEDQFTGFTQAGYVGSRSPDRADAAIWGMTHLFPQISRGTTTSVDGVSRNPAPKVVHSRRMRQLRRRR